MTRVVVKNPIEAEASKTEYADGQSCPTPEQVARLAYDIYERRGRRDGHDVEDWLSAERVLARQCP